MKTQHLRTMKTWPLFMLCAEQWDTENGDPATTMEVYRTLAGYLLDCRFKKRRPGLIKFIAREGVAAELASPKDSVCTIGRCIDGSWYGWSHRAICKFTTGDKLFNAEYADRTDELPHCEWGDTVIETEKQARQAAINFGAYVS